MNRGTMFWVIAVYLLISFVPALGLGSLLGKLGGGGKNKGAS